MSAHSDTANFLSIARRVIEADAASTQIRHLADCIFSAVPPAGQVSAGTPGERLPVCRHLATALRNADGESDLIRNLALAVAEIEPRLTWRPRAGAASHGEAFLRGHANAIVASVPGTATAGDVQIGVSLMAPHTQYPMHHHPPDEIYIVMSDGDWFQETAGWFTPGIGKLVYNPSDLVHAMRSGEQPLLAFWFLGSPS